MDERTELLTAKPLLTLEEGEEGEDEENFKDFSNLENIQINFNGLIELKPNVEEIIKESKYYNEDLAPIKINDRNWGIYQISVLWIGMVICIPAYMIAAGMMANGLTWWQSILLFLLQISFWLLFYNFAHMLVCFY